MKIPGIVHKCQDCEKVFLTLVDNPNYCPFCSSQSLLVDFEEQAAREELDKISKRMKPMTLAQ